MMTSHDKCEVLRALRNRDDLELTADELNKMLEDELARPAEEMDTELVETLTLLLEDVISDAARHTAWQRLTRRLQRQTIPVARHVLRIAAILVAAAGLAVLTWHTAEAINDRFLVRQEIPGTSAFVVMSNPDAVIPTADVPPAIIDPQLVGSLVVVNNGDYTHTTYTALADCPEMLYGYRVVPSWLPDDFVHVMSVYYEDPNTVVVNHRFMQGGQTVIFDVTIYKNPASVVYSELATEGVHNETYISGVPVLFYQFGTQRIPCAHFLTGMAEYNLAGIVSQENMNSIIASTINSTEQED